ncbi:MAG: phosphatase PAP2 family protein [Bacteroidales bacterium]|nr:phosphatase PAP2 family protein [Bacteroidales bacterium]
MWIKSLAICLTMAGGGTNTSDSLNNTSPDSLSSQEARVECNVAVPLGISATLITAGAIGVSNGWMCKTKRSLRNEIQGWSDGDKRFRADDYLQYLPLAVNIGLDFTGIKARHNFRERLAVSATATALHVGLTQGLKWCVDEERPNGRNANSFPSGHTSWSFMGAELIREEYGWAWGAGAYTFATGIAFLRLYNDEHWLNDILAGAGIGILSARMAYLLLPLERRLFRWDKTSHTTTCIPIYSPENQAVGLAFHVEF